MHPLLPQYAMAVLTAALLAGCGGRQGRVKDHPVVAPQGQRPGIQTVAVRYPSQHYITAIGRGATRAEARATAKLRLLEAIDSRLEAVRCEGCPEEARLTEHMPRFKYGALVEVLDPMPEEEGGFAALAVLRRDRVAPLIEEDIRTVREKLEAWRRQVRRALEEGADRARLMELCREPTAPMLEDLERLRLTLAVVTSDATVYHPSDDLKSVLDLRTRAGAALGAVPVYVISMGGRDDRGLTRRIADEVKRLAAAAKLEAKVVPGDRKPPDGPAIFLTVEPTFHWSKDTFHFLRTGLSVEGRFAERPGAFLQLNVDPASTKGGGVKKDHAARESLAKVFEILDRELPPKLPDLTCAMAW